MQSTALNRSSARHRRRWLFANLAQLCMNAEDMDGTLGWGSRAMELAEHLGSTERHVHALNSIGTVEFLRGDDAGREKLEQRLELARQTDLEYDIARAFAHLSWASVRLRSHVLAGRYIEAGLECSERDLDRSGTGCSRAEPARNSTRGAGTMRQ